MVKVRVQRNFYLTGHGSVSRGAIIEASEQTARALVHKRLVARVDEETDDASEKVAPPSRNKMRPPVRNKSNAGAEEYEPGIVATPDPERVGGADDNNGPGRRR